MKRNKIDNGYSSPDKNATNKMLALLMFIVFAITNGYAQGQFSNDVTLGSLTSMTNRTDLEELNEYLDIFDFKYQNSNIDKGVEVFTWSRSEEKILASYVNGKLVVVYAFNSIERFKNLQQELPENGFEKIEDQSSQQKYANEYYYVTFQTNETYVVDAKYKFACICIKSFEEYEAERPGEADTILIHSRFSAKDLVDFVTTNNKDFIQKQLKATQWEPAYYDDEDELTWFAFDELVSDCPLPDEDKSMVIFKPQVTIQSHFYSTVNYVDYNDEGASEDFFCFMPKESEKDLGNIIVVKLFRTKQD